LSGFSRYKNKRFLPEKQKLQRVPARKKWRGQMCQTLRGNSPAFFGAFLSEIERTI
jgi:hypothetical protein